MAGFEDSAQKVATFIQKEQILGKKEHNLTRT